MYLHYVLFYLISYLFGTPRVTPYFRGVSAYLAEPSGVKVALVLIGNWEVNYTEIK